MVRQKTLIYEAKKRFKDEVVLTVRPGDIFLLAYRFHRLEKLLPSAKIIFRPPWDHSMSN